MKRNRKEDDRQAVEDWIDRCTAEAELLNTLTGFIAGELRNGRTVTECRVEVARRWPETRYKVLLQALENAKQRAL